MKSSDARVQTFLNDLQGAAPDKYEILQAARELVFNQFPQVTERIMYGGIMFTLKEDFGGLFPSQKHVSFEFGQGFALEDKDKKLEGTGKFRRHLKLASGQDISSKNLVYFLKQLA